MYHRLRIYVVILAVLGLSACAAQKVEPPTSGPTAQLTVTVSNFVELSLIEAENGWVSLYNQDKSWGAEPLLKYSHPSEQYIIPANQPLNFSLFLQKAGPGFDGGCRVNVDLNATENSKLALDFTIQRVSDEDDAMTGCSVALSEDGKLIREYQGEGKITVYKVKVVAE